MDETTVRIIAGVGALVLLGLYFMRRGSKKKQQNED